MIKCVIVDDEQHAIDLLTGYLRKIPGIELALTTTKSIEAFHYIQNHKIDLVYLDIHMPELDGIQFLKLLSGKAKVILTTAYPEYALEGYEHDIVDYLLKPIMFDRFMKATQKAINILRIKDTPIVDDYIFVKGESRSKLVKIKITDILYVESLGNYVSFYVDESRIITLVTMKEVEEKLSGRLFIRTHKSFIVAIDKIDSVEGNQVFIGKTAIPLGETYKESFFSAISRKILNVRK